MLDRTRYTVAWRALGLATASYELALAHALRREQFGQPIAGFQLVQDKLARMLAEITSMQLMCWRLSKLADAGRMTAAMASLAKMNHAAKARAIVADARDILGGDGILLDNHVARHHADMEAIFTFEGTDSVQALIVGREITGLSAISGRKPTRWRRRPGAERVSSGPVVRPAVIRAHSGQAVRPDADPRPLLRAPHLDDRPADGELDLAVELAAGAVRLHCVPRAAVLRRMPVRPSVGAGEPHRVGLHVERVPHVTAGQSPLPRIGRPYRRLRRGRRPVAAPAGLPEAPVGRLAALPSDDIPIGRSTPVEPVSLLVGGVLLAVGFVAGRLGRRRAGATPAGDPPVRLRPRAQPARPGDVDLLRGAAPRHLRPARPVGRAHLGAVHLPPVRGAPPDRRGVRTAAPAARHRLTGIDPRHRPACTRLTWVPTGHCPGRAFCTTPEGT